MIVKKLLPAGVEEAEMEAQVEEVEAPVASRRISRHHSDWLCCR
jgi:hypothetical protein